MLRRISAPQFFLRTLYVYMCVFIYTRPQNWNRVISMITQYKTSQDKC